MCAHQSPHLVQRLILTNEANPKIYSTYQVENTNNLPLWQIVAKITFGISQLDFGENHYNIRGVAAAESCLTSSERIKLPTYKHGDESCTQLRGEVSSAASVKYFTPPKFKHRLQQSSKDQSSFVWSSKSSKDVQNTSTSLQKMCRIQAHFVFDDVHTSGITSCTRANILHYLMSYSP
ncbi:hypothetical protein QL285_051621 [Trifolium repens]|nr:hypothetical protein QL285_051621 [Trifolium repens]